MDDIIKRFCPRYDFDSYEDMKQNFKINVPDDFNFGFDVVDAWADIEPEKLALVWTNDAGDMARYTFKDIKDNSNRAVNFLLEKGIKKGDIVMLVLKQRPEVWFIITALHKIGAIVIPASFQLMKKDYVYRINAAGVKMLITVGDDDVVQHVGIGHILVGIGRVLLNWVLNLDDDGWIAVLREGNRVQQFSIGILDVLELCEESVERFLVVGH